MNKKIGIIIGVVIAVVAVILGIVFFTSDKDASVDNPSEGISQSDVVNQEKVTDATELEKTTPIDLTTVELNKYGISSNYEISEQYPTEDGCIYYVRDFQSEKEGWITLYWFFTTADDIFFAKAEELPMEEYVFPNGYNFYDINNDGVEELIINNKIGVKEYTVFTFADSKMDYVGKMMDEHGSLYGKNGTVTTVSREFSDEPDSEPWVVYDTFEFTENKLVHKDHGFCDPLDGAEKSQFGNKVTFNQWDKN